MQRLCQPPAAFPLCVLLCVKKVERQVQPAGCITPTPN